MTDSLVLMGIEVSRSIGDDGTWHCWLRRDTAGRYSRFIHIRHLRTQTEVIVLIEALTGQAWDSSNNLWGSMHAPARAARIRAEQERLDHRVLMEWNEPEEDDTRGRALPRAYGRSGEAGWGTLVVQAQQTKGGQEAVRAAPPERTSALV